MKSLIKENLVMEGMAGGWMHDFGEYLPFDAVMFDGSDPV
jgi:alpha-glucosidase